jgi:FlaA1/EpsC-like NDP-sugar epimerase
MNSIATTRDSGLATAAPQKALGVRERLLALPRSHKRLLQIVIDILLIWVALWLAFYLRLDDALAISPFHGHAWLFIAAPLVSVPVFARFGLYRAVMRYVGYQTLMTIGFAVTASAAVLGLCILLYADPPAMVPRSIAVIYWLLTLMLIGGLRLVMRQYFRKPHNNTDIATAMRQSRGRRRDVRVAIYGAGDAGNQLLMALRLGNERRAVAFIDDNLELSGRVMAGLPVYAPADLERLMKNTHATEVLLAIPSAPRCRHAEIINFLAPYPVKVRTIPGFMDLASGRVQVQDLREVDITDLLGRDPVQPHVELFERCIRGQVVLVTGAGGSIGSELCRQIVTSGPRSLILFEQCEFNLYSVHVELEALIRSRGLDVELIPVLSSVRNEDRLLDVMSIWEVDTVYHAAAYKHVPMVERNISEGIINNVYGTLYAAQAAMRAGVKNFVLISTDKAVRPTSTMGSSKRLAELVLQALAKQATVQLYGDEDGGAIANPTRFTMVRFGNVLGSSGSVIPRFREQIRSGGPLTVTHPDITRYFMTIPEAAQLVIQAGAMGQGGDVFVLDMGEPVKIRDLAANMILLSGLTVRSAQNPRGDISIEFVGLRPGEKLYEELLIGDNVTPTDHPMIMRADEKSVGWEQLKSMLAELGAALRADDYVRIRQIFFSLVDGYSPDEEMVDWIQLQQLAGRTSCGNNDHFNTPEHVEAAHFGT